MNRDLALLNPGYRLSPRDGYVMRTDLRKEIGVIIFFNTSLTEEEESRFFDIYEELYRFGLWLKAKSASSR